MLNNYEKLFNDGMCIFANADLEAPDALEGWELEDFEDILPREARK